MTSKTGRYATILDVNHTASSRVPICSFYLKVRTQHRVPIILHFHESPLNKNLPVSIASEYQIREFGLAIDSVAGKHRLGPDSYGTQRFQLNEGVHIPFQDLGGLMGFETLPYEEGDDARYDVVDVTDHTTRWRPARFGKCSSEPPVSITPHTPSTRYGQQASATKMALGIGTIPTMGEIFCVLDDPPIVPDTGGALAFQCSFSSNIPWQPAI